MISKTNILTTLGKIRIGLVKKSCHGYANRSRGFCTIYSDPYSAVRDIPKGSKILLGGFGLCGIPEKLIQALARSGVSDLTLVSNNAGTDEHGIGLLFRNKQVKRLVGSHIGSNKECARQYLCGELELELLPQGTIVEKLRSGGAGIPAFFTHTGYNTWVHQGKMPLKYDQDGNVLEYGKPREVRTFGGREYLLEEAITADYAFVKAWKADTYGNLVFRKSAANLNSPMAKAARVTIAEVEEIVEPGAIPSEHVHIPSIYVHRMVRGENYLKPIERLAFRSSTEDQEDQPRKDSLSARQIIAQRAACDLEDGMYINIGIGVPEGLTAYLPKTKKVFVQSENGILGMGPKPLKHEVDADLVNAGKETTSVLSGGAFFPSDDSFAMIRGGHVNVTFLGCMEVSEYGDLANWMIPKVLVKGIGGAMDLVSHPNTRVVIMTEHCTKNGKSKIVKSCSLPLTGYRVVSRIITENAVFDVCPSAGLTLQEKRASLSVQDVRNITACDFKISATLSDMKNVIFGTI